MTSIVGIGCTIFSFQKRCHGRFCRGMRETMVAASTAGTAVARVNSRTPALRLQ